MAIPLAASLGISAGSALLGWLGSRNANKLPPEVLNRLQSLYDRAMGGDGDARQSFMDEFSRISRDYALDMRGRAGESYSAPYPGGYWDSQFYTPEEQAGILDEGGLTGLEVTPEELEAMGYTQPEIEQILGNPYEAFNFFGEQGARAQDDLGVTEGRLFDTLAEQGRNIRGGTADAGRRGYASLEGGSRNLRGISGDPRLGLAEGYQAELNAIADGPSLGLDAGFASGYEFSDKDREGLEYLANRGVGAKYDQLMEQTRQEMQRRGANNPLALAGLANEFQSEAAADAGDAAVGARIEGRGEQLNRMRDKEGMRLSAEANRARTRLSARESGERTRLGAEQFRANLARAVEEGILDRDLDLNRFLAGLNLQGEQYLGSSQLNTIQQAGRERQDVARDIRTGGAALLQGADRDRSGRNTTVANARTDQARYAPNLRFQQGMALSGVRSGRRQGIANTRLGFENERRGFFTGQGNLASGQWGSGVGQAANFWGQRGQTAANALQGQVGASQWQAQQPTGWQGAIAGGLGAFGALAGNTQWRRPGGGSTWGGQVDYGGG